MAGTDEKKGRKRKVKGRTEHRWQTLPCGLRENGKGQIFHCIAEAMFFEEGREAESAMRTLSGGRRSHLFANVVYEG
jgi:hypothetical protein